MPSKNPASKTDDGTVIDGVPELRLDARRNQQRILRAAARLLAEDSSVSIQRIADEAEVARPTVYRRYPNKDALVDAILAEAVGEFGAALRDAAAADGDAAEAIGRLVRSLGEIGANYPVLLGELDVPHERHQDAHHGRLAEMGTILVEFDALISRGQTEGTIRVDLSPDVLRHCLLGSLAMSLRLTRRSDFPLTSSAIAGQVAALLVEGIRPR